MTERSLQPYDRMKRLGKMCPGLPEHENVHDGCNCQIWAATDLGAMNERARIVGWLRAIPQGECAPRAFADLIESGVKACTIDTNTVSTAPGMTPVPSLPACTCPPTHPIRMCPVHGVLAEQITSKEHKP